MSKKKSGPKPGSNASAREQMRAERAKQQAATRRKERMLRIGIGVGVALVIIAIVGVIQWQRSQISASGAEGTPYPKPVAAGYGKPVQARVDGLAAADKKVADAKKSGNKKALDEAEENRKNLRGFWQGVGTGKANAPVVVELFEDFSCPHCKEFEDAGAQEALKPYVDKGQVRVVSYPVTLDGFTQNGLNNDKAANAYLCAADEGKGAAYHQALFANVPADGVWTDKILTDLGAQVGLDSAGFKSCAKSTRFYPYEDSIDQVMTDKKLEGTPAVLVNGKNVDYTTAQTLVENMKVEIDKDLDQAKAK